MAKTRPRRAALAAAEAARRPIAATTGTAAIAAVALITLLSGRARANAPPAGRSAEAAPAVFALILGVNASPSPDVAPLQYADDDAANYLDLFRALGARTYILSRLDGNTRRLHPQAAAEAVPPRKAELKQAVDGLVRDVAQARARGVRSTLYVIYAGHGEAEDEGLSLTLEDARLGGRQLMAEIVERAAADQSHVIIDACHAYLLALPRGPGGTRRPLSGFVELEAATRAGRVGYLLSSSVSGESHEWAGFEAGVFSHEVRSGLYGAADADGDRRVTYAEMGAFVARANQAIANDRFRPQVLARAPRDGDLLLDLRSRRGRELRMEGPEGGAHYLLENNEGVRLLDFHGGGTAAVHLLHPVGDGPLYLRRVADGLERTVPRVDGPVEMAALPASPSRVRSRDAAHHAFSQIFSLGFDEGVVDGWSRRAADVEARMQSYEQVRDQELRRQRWRRMTGVGALGLGAVAAVGAALFERSAQQLHDQAPIGESERDAVARNEKIDARNHLALGFAAGAVAAGVTGGLLLLWPRRPPTAPELDLAFVPGRTDVGARWRF